MKINSDCTEEQYNKENAWGLLTSIDLQHCDPKIIKDAKKIQEYIDELVKTLKMIKFGPTTIVDFGENDRVSGFSMTQLIETSLISGHFANQTNAVFIDIFSCKYYNPKDAAEFTKQFFKAKSYKMNCLIRKDCE